ncbi:MAG: dipeptide/oligopeptide/nickel ABC transporter permease/ATP-binding protein, partial [Pseudomonadota bacterium]
MTGFLRSVARNRLALVGATVLTGVVLLAVLTPLLPLNEPNVTNTAERFKLPFSDGAMLGTDHLGRDLLSRLLWGTQLSLLVGFSAAAIAAMLGSAVGIVAGYYGGKTDNVLMRGIDMLMAFPYILLALAIVAALGPGLFNALIAVAVVNIPFFARNIRGVTVGIVRQDYVDAARLAGLSNTRIILTEVLPNVVPVIVVAASTTVGWMILETAGLSFLGLGSQPPQADLGSMLGEARSALITHPHTSIVPGVMILIVVLAINLAGDGVRDALDPRLNAGALSHPKAVTDVERADIELNRAPEQPGAILSVHNLETQFRRGDHVHTAVGSVTLAVNPGECLGVIGESGSGKSVTALSVTRLVASPPGVIANGSVHLGEDDLLGVPFGTLRRIRGKKIAYIFQDPLSTLHPLYSIGEQLVEAIRTHQPLSKRDAQQRAIELLEAVRIPDPSARMTAFPHQLSGGMRQRVSIAMALSNDPDVIIADEPTTALDVTIQAQILSLLDELRRRRGLAIVFITHDFGVAAQVCDRLAVMYAGEIVEQGSARAVLLSPRHPYTAALLACVPTFSGVKKRLESIPGLPPHLGKVAQGCGFASRCGKAT